MYDKLKLNELMLATFIINKFQKLHIFPNKNT